MTRHEQIVARAEQEVDQILLQARDRLSDEMTALGYSPDQVRAAITAHEPTLEAARTSALDQLRALLAKEDPAGVAPLDVLTAVATIPDEDAAVEMAEHRFDLRVAEARREWAEERLAAGDSPEAVKRALREQEAGITAARDTLAADIRRLARGEGQAA